MGEREEIRRRRDGLWAQQNAKAARPRVPVELRKPALFTRDGRTFIKKRWGQELPADSDESYFWDLLQQLRAQLAPGAIARYMGPAGADLTEERLATVRVLLADFAAWALAEAQAQADERDDARERALDSELDRDEEHT